MRPKRPATVSSRRWTVINLQNTRMSAAARAVQQEHQRQEDERRKHCTKCGTHVAHTEDWTLYPWPDGARLCSSCNDDRLETEEYPG